LARIESELQDLLAEPLTSAVIDMLRLASTTTAPLQWLNITSLRELLTDGERAQARVGQEIAEAVVRIRADMADNASPAALVDTVLAAFDEAKFRAHFPAYRDGTFFDDLKGKLTKALERCCEGRAWSAALDELEGTNTIPILTTHKSKGLEHEIVVFVGLEDAAHFSSLEEETSTFFVALSRAKRRAVFTYSGSRLNYRGQLQDQARDAISSLYDALAAQGIYPTRGVPDEELW